MITIIFGQCNDTTRTKIALRTTYAADRDAGNVINFHKRLRTVCYESDDGGLPQKLYKMVVAVKSLHNFSNSKTNDPHALKEELKIEFGVVSAIVGKFRIRTGIIRTFTPSRDSITRLGRLLCDGYS